MAAARAEAAFELAAVLEAQRAQLAQKDDEFATAAAAADWEHQMAIAAAESAAE